MTTVSRRAFLALTAAGAAIAAGRGVRAANAGPASKGLSSLTREVAPITEQEHGARLAKVQSLMQQRRIAALLVEAGSTLEYFTGIRWHRSERTTAALIPAEGGVVVVTPFFEEPSVRETLKVAADVRPWKEDESPFKLLAGALREHAVPGPLAVEATTRYFIVERMMEASAAAPRIIPGDDLVRACRMFKSPADAGRQQRHDRSAAARARTHQRRHAGLGHPRHDDRSDRTAGRLARVLTGAAE
jgi:Xaa-Pro dipeptidase